MSMRVPNIARSSSLSSAFAASPLPFAALLLGALMLTSVGCMQPGPSLVGQGQQYIAGDAEFDSYFAKLHTIQTELATLPVRESENRQKLAKALAADEQSSTGALARSVRKRAQMLAQSGVFMRFELEDDDEASAQAEIVLSGRRPPLTDHDFLEALHVAAEVELKLSLHMTRLKHDLEELRFRAVKLDKDIDTAFRLSGPRKKAEVRSNLDDSIALMPILVVQADEAHDNADRLLRKLVDATRIDGPPFNATVARVDDRTKPKPSPPPANAPPTDERPRPARRAPRRAAAPAPATPKPAPPPKAAPKPAPKPLPAQDFEP